jgi:hypothetical protein
MSNFTNRRHFIELVPFVGVALLAACSPKTETVTPPAPTSPAPPVQPSPPPVPAPTEATAPKTPPDSPVTTVMPLVDEKDAQAVSLGYVADNTRADNVKFKNHIAGSKCSGCSLYLGKAGDADGGCPLFQGKKVSANGWCSAWVKKA